MLGKHSKYVHFCQSFLQSYRLSQASISSFAMWETALLFEWLSPGRLSFLFKMNAVCAWKFENKQPFKSKSTMVMNNIVPIFILIYLFSSRKQTIFKKINSV